MSSIFSAGKMGGRRSFGSQPSQTPSKKGKNEFRVKIVHCKPVGTEASQNGGIFITANGFGERLITQPFFQPEAVGHTLFIEKSEATIHHVFEEHKDGEPVVNDNGYPSKGFVALANGTDFTKEQITEYVNSLLMPAIKALPANFKTNQWFYDPEVDYTEVKHWVSV